MASSSQVHARRPKEAPVSRAEHEAVLARLAVLEAAQRRPRGPSEGDIRVLLAAVEATESLPFRAKDAIEASRRHPQFAHALAAALIDNAWQLGKALARLHSAGGEFDDVKLARVTTDRGAWRWLVSRT